MNQKHFIVKFATGIGVVIFVLVCIYFLQERYAEQQIKQRIELKIQEEKHEKERLINLKKENQRKDSVYKYIQAAMRLQKSSPEKALLKINSAYAFIPQGDEITSLKKIKEDIILKKITTLINRGQYQAALQPLNGFIQENNGNNQMLYYRALCYSKTGMIKEAANDLTFLMRNNFVPAKKLYNKINPVRKKLIGYVTRCCDGTTSSARGRGACSWHGGVCNWNDPIYEEYRKY